MSWISNIIVKITGDNKGLDKSLNESEGKLGKFKGAILGAATAGAAAFAILINWAKETVWGIDAMNKSLTVSKQLLTDVIMKDGLHLKQASEVADRQNKIRFDNAKEVWQIAKMQSELNQLIVQSADQTLSHAEKLKILTKAMEKEKQLKEFLIADAKEEMRVAYDAWQLNITNEAAREQFYRAAARLEEAKAMNSRRLQSQYTAELQAQIEKEKALIDAFTPLPEDVAEANRQMELFRNKTQQAADAAKMMVTDFSNLAAPDFGLQRDNTLAGAPQGGSIFNPYMFTGKDYIPQIEDWKATWESAIMDVTSLLSDAFIRVFESIGSGSFEGFGDDLLRNFGNLVANLGKMLVALGTTMLLAQTLLKTPSIPTAIAAIAAGGAAMAIGGLMMGAASRGAKSLSSGGSGGGGGYGVANGMQTIKVEVEGKISGKDIVIASKRFLNDN